MIPEYHWAFCGTDSVQRALNPTHSFESARSHHDEDNAVGVTTKNKQTPARAKERQQRHEMQNALRSPSSAAAQHAGDDEHGEEDHEISEKFKNTWNLIVFFGFVLVFVPSGGRGGTGEWGGKGRGRGAEMRKVHVRARRPRLSFLFLLHLRHSQHPRELSSA